MLDKLTDSEIVKAYECCSEPAGKCICRECPLHQRDGSCTTLLVRYSLDLINRLQCERNKYRRKVQNQREEINRLKTENEMLKPFKSNLLKVMGDNIQKTKVEVVKEFAKLCIDKSQNGIIQVSDMPDYVIEMVGE